MRKKVTAETPARTETEIITELWEKSDSVKKSVEELFVIECKECGSKDVKLFHDMDFTEGTGGGCESCGYGGDGGSAKFLLALKCMKCGNAKVVKEKRGEMYG